MLETNTHYESSENIKISAKIVKAENANGVIIMTHGINSNKEEDGLFTELAYKISLNHCHNFWFDDHGYGENTGVQQEMTIKGEIEDLKNNIDYVKKITDLSIIILVASFRVVSTLEYINNKVISKLILLNPVLDLDATFLDPNLLLGKNNFNKQSFDKLKNWIYSFR